MSEGGMRGDIKGSGAERTDRDGVVVASSSDGDGAHYANAAHPGPADDSDEEMMERELWQQYRRDSSAPLRMASGPVEPPSSGELMGPKVACVACKRMDLKVVAGNPAHTCRTCNWPVHAALLCDLVCVRILHCVAQSATRFAMK